MRNEHDGENLYALIQSGILFPIPEITARWLLLKSGWEPQESIQRMRKGQIVPINQCVGDLILLSTAYKYRYYQTLINEPIHEVTYRWVRPLKLVKYQDEKTNEEIYDEEEQNV